MPPPPDVLAMGRVGVDVYPLQIGVGLEEVTTFGKFLGGSAANVAVAAARHGCRSVLVARTGDDPFGRYLHTELADLGVDPTHVGVDPEMPTPVTFCEIFPPDNFPIYFYRYPIAPDLRITPEELPTDDVASAGVFWTTLTGLSIEPSRSTHVAAWAIRGRRRHTVVDLDYRPVFWPSEEEARTQAEAAIAASTVAVGNLEECRVAVGEAEPDRAADALLDRGVELAVVKQGHLGVLAATTDERVTVPPTPVEVLNGLGAGDAFGGALCRGLLRRWPLRRVIEFASAAGALVAGRLECSTAMPTEAEVEELLARTSGGAGD